MGEAVIDERGRIVIPNELRVELGLRPEQKLKVLTKGKELVLSPAIGPDEFISNLKGCIHGSNVKPEALKDTWGVRHAHDRL
jgi:AbrB family looped-hinge helix DNA binding protein